MATGSDATKNTISRDLTLTVSGKTASLSESCFIYRGDRGITLNIKIQQYKYKFNRKTVENVLSTNDETTIAYARVLVHKPNSPIHEPKKPNNSTNTQYENGELVDPAYCFQIPIAHVFDDTLQIPITADWVDQLDEVGIYTLQIQLYGIDPVNNRVTIPPVQFEVLEPMCDLTEEPYPSEDAIADGSRASFAIIRQPGEEFEADFDKGIYNREPWVTGDVITVYRLEKFESALEYSIETLANMEKEVYNKEEIDSKLENMVVDAYTTAETDKKLSDQKDEILTTINENVENINVQLDTKSDKTHDHSTSFNGQNYTTIQETFNAVSESIDDNVESITSNITSVQNNLSKSISSLDKKLTDDLNNTKTKLSGNITALDKKLSDNLNTTKTDLTKYIDDEITDVRADIPTKNSQLENDSNFLVSLGCKRVEFVDRYPDRLDDGVLYILIEEYI